MSLMPVDRTQNHNTYIPTIISNGRLCCRFCCKSIYGLILIVSSFILFMGDNYWNIDTNVKLRIFIPVMFVSILVEINRSYRESKKDAEITLGDNFCDSLPSNKCELLSEILP